MKKTSISDYNVNWGERFVCFSKFCVAAAVVTLMIFLFHHGWSLSNLSENDVLGTYGDFIGGVIGTAVALYSAYLLVATLNKQTEVNEDVIMTNHDIIATNQSTVEVNKETIVALKDESYNRVLELFSSKFESFLLCYNKAIDAYRYKNIKGRNAFEQMANDFLESEFNNKNDYYRRSLSATEAYNDFYAQNRIYLSVHFRMLYLLVSLISSSKLNDGDKVLYAKLIRGQLSDAETVLLRYNCKSYYGQKMQEFCNEFNLIKHIPLMRLLEFKYCRTILEHKNADKTEVEKLSSGLDALFINLRKHVKSVLDEDNDCSSSYITNKKRYTFKILRTENGQRVDFMIERNYEASAQGGGYPQSSEEKALDCFSDEELECLFRDFLSELLYVSNFGLYGNGAKNVNKIRGAKKQKISTFKWTINNNKRLVLSAQKNTENG